MFKTCYNFPVRCIAQIMPILLSSITSRILTKGIGRNKVLYSMNEKNFTSTSICPSSMHMFQSKYFSEF